MILIFFVVIEVSAGSVYSEWRIAILAARIPVDPAPSSSLLVPWPVRCGPVRFTLFSLNCSWSTLSVLHWTSSSSVTWEVEYKTITNHKTNQSNILEFRVWQTQRTHSGFTIAQVPDICVDGFFHSRQSYVIQLSGVWWARWSYVTLILYLTRGFILFMNNQLVQISDVFFWEMLQIKMKQ